MELNRVGRTHYPAKLMWMPLVAYQTIDGVEETYGEFHVCIYGR